MRDASRHPPRSHFRCLNQHCAWKSSHTDCDLMALRVNTSCSHCSMRGAIMNLWNDDMIRTYFIRRSSLWMIILHHSLILIDTETVTFPWLPLMLPPTLFLHLYPQVCVCVSDRAGLPGFPPDLPHYWFCWFHACHTCHYQVIAHLCI